MSRDLLSAVPRQWLGVEEESRGLVYEWPSPRVHASIISFSATSTGQVRFVAGSCSAGGRPPAPHVCFDAIKPLGEDLGVPVWHPRGLVAPGLLLHRGEAYDGD